MDKIEIQTPSYEEFAMGWLKKHHPEVYAEDDSVCVRVLCERLNRLYCVNALTIEQYGLNALIERGYKWEWFEVIVLGSGSTRIYVRRGGGAELSDLSDEDIAAVEAAILEGLGFHTSRIFGRLDEKNRTGAYGHVPDTSSRAVWQHPTRG